MSSPTMRKPNWRPPPSRRWPSGGRMGGPMAGVATWTRRYGALIRAAWLVDLQYGATIAIWLIWGVLEPTIALGIWWSIARGGAVQGYGQADFARYFFGVTL